MHLTTRLLISQGEREEWILLNMLTGAVDAVDKEGYTKFQRMKEGDFSSLEADFVNVLKRRGYIFEDQREEDQLLGKMLEQYRKRFSNCSIKAVICPTFTCNLRCTYCFQANLREKVPATLKDGEITLLFRALDEIVKREKAPGAQIQLFGGEPLLPRCYHLIECILKSAFERSYPVGIVTNGVNLSRFLSLLKQYRDCIGNMQITIDGPARVHNRRRKFVSGRGTFERIAQGVDLILELGIATIVRVNVDLENVDFLPELAEFIHKKG